MKLEPEGKTRLETMKKRLAAGLPLAGMLAALAAVGASTEGCLGTPMGRFPSEPPPEEWVLDGDIVASPDLSPGIPEVPVVPDVPEVPELPPEEAPLP